MILEAARRWAVSGPFIRLPTSGTSGSGPGPLLFMTFLLGCAFLAIYVYIYFSSPRARSAEIARAEARAAADKARAVARVAEKRLVDVRPGDVVAVTGRVIAGGGNEPIASPWARQPLEVRGHIVLDDGSGKTLQIGRGEIGSFHVGDIVFAVGAIDGRSADDAYRSAEQEVALGPAADGLFLVVRGTRAEALKQLRARPPVDWSLHWLPLVGCLLVLLAVLLNRG